MVGLTNEYERREEMRRMKHELLLNVNKVIDRQMHVAQEIADLLGKPGKAVHLECFLSYASRHEPIQGCRTPCLAVLIDKVPVGRLRLDERKRLCFRCNPEWIAGS
jgi:hypothetical protein